MLDDRAEQAIAVLQQVTGDEDDVTALDAALARLREVVANSRHKDGDWLRYLLALSSGLYTRFAMLGTQDDLDDAVLVVRREIADAPAELQSDLRYDLMDTLWTRFQYFGDPADLNDSIDLARQLSGFDGPALASVLAFRSEMLAHRYAYGQDLADLDEAITAVRGWGHEVRDDAELRAVAQASLGGALRRRFERQSRRADLDEAIAVLEEAVPALPPDHPHRQVGAYELSVVLMKRFLLTRDPDDINAAVTVARTESAQESSQEPSENPVLLSGLAEALNARFVLLADQADLDEAITVMARAVAMLPDDHPDWAVFRNSLANFLRVRAVHTGAADDLDNAIDVGREAANGLQAGHPFLPQTLNNLTLSLRARATASDLDEAVELGRLASAVVHHPNRQLYLYGLCMSLCRRFERTGDPGDLDEAADVGATALDLPAPDPAPLVALLAEVLYKRYELARDPADLDQSILLARSVSATPAATTSFLFKLANVLWVRFETTGDPTDRDDAIDLGSRAARAGTDEPNAVQFCATVVTMLRTRFAATGRMSDLDDAVAIARHGLAIAQDDLDALSCLAGALWARFDSTGARTDLDDGIAVGERLLAVIPDDHEDLAGFRAAFAGALRRRFELTGEQTDLAAAQEWERRARIQRDPFADVVGPDDGAGWAVKRGLEGHALAERAIRENDPAALDRAIVLVGEAIELSPEVTPATVEMMSNLAAALSRRFTRVGDRADLDRAIDLGRAAVAAGGPSVSHGALADASFTRFIRFGELSDVDEAVAVGRTALDLLAHDEDRVAALSNLGIALRVRFTATAQPADLDEAVSVGRAAVAAADDRDRAIPLSNLGATLLLRFDRFGARVDLDEGVEVGRAAVAASAPEHPDHAAALANLAASLRERAEWSAEPGDLDEAIALGRAAVAASPPGYAERPMYLSNLGNALRQRYIRTDDRADLDSGIAASRAAVAACPDGHPERPRYLSNLSLHLRGRFADLGEPADLAEAVRAGREAVAAAAPGHPERPKYLSNLGMTLQFHPADLTRSTADDAVELCRAALAEAEPADPAWPMYLSNLASALRTRFGLGNDLADLDEATTLAHAAVSRLPAGHQDDPVYRSMLPNLALARATATGAPADLDAAIEAARVPSTPGIATILARALLLRYERTGAVADLDEALTRYLAAAAEPTSTPADRLTAGIAAGALAAEHGRWSDALDGFATAVELMPQAAWRGIGRASRERQLARWTGIAAAAAACALTVDRPDRAIELLEQGRGVLWSQSLDARTDLSALRKVAPAIATQLTAVRGKLDVETNSVDERMSLAVQWDALTTQARGLPGFETFLRPSPAARLRAAAAGGPVVLVNTSPWRCDALVVTTDEVRVVELPTLTEDDVVEHTNTYVGALLAAEAGDVFAELDIIDTLEWLWDTVAEPVLAAIGTVSRLWWCPTGPFSLLPLHAAGHHGEHDGRTVLDRVVSSYTPTLRSLIEAHTADSRSPADNRLLIVALPDTPDQPPLPNVERERELLTDLFAGARHTLREGPHATVAEVREQLGKHAWSHFSCHGQQQLDDPSQGGLLLHDGMLTIAELTNERYRGEFAFLSACKTALGGAQLPDEAINLASALRYAGWRHVIGTLWSVRDDTAADLTTDVYRALATHGELQPDTAATALHEAVHRQRDTAPHRPSIWAPFIHVGP